MSRLLAGASLIAILSAGLALPPMTEATATATPSSGTARHSMIPGFAEVVERVKPAVVSVRVRMGAGSASSAGRESGDAPGRQNPFAGTPFEKFFKDFGSEGRRAPGPEGGAVQALGSGFLISADGLVVTNNHVVNGGDTVEVMTDAGATYKARVLGTDARTDLALLKIEGTDPFPFVPLAEAKPRIGDWVLAMGNPFGLGGSVTAGIVSAEGRDLGAGPYDDFIQYDASVNTGNSGGPTFNLAGEVIAVNTAILSPSGGSVGIAFGIPSTTVKSVVAQLESKGHVDRAWLGVQIQPVTRELAESLGLGAPKGAIIASADTTGPGAKAGLGAGDVIVRVDGTEVADARALTRTIGSMMPGTEVAIDYIRNGKAETVRLVLGELKDPTPRPARLEGESSSIDALGLEVRRVASGDGATGRGLVVTAVRGDGPAAVAGIVVGDVVVSAGGREVSSPDDLTSAVAATRAANKGRILLFVRGRAGDRFVTLPVAVG